jgi:hypothetical protein
MQPKTPNEKSRPYAPDGSHLETAEIHWRQAEQRNPTHVCNVTFFESIRPGAYQFRFLNEDLQIDLTKRLLLRNSNDRWEPLHDSLLTMVTLMYLKAADLVYPLGRDIIGINDLKESHFFAGPHALRLDPLLVRYGNDLAGFKNACRKLGGQQMDMADSAFRLLPFPRVPIYFLLWVQDIEYMARVTVLVDRSIEYILAADAIWALINRVAISIADA